MIMCLKFISFLQPCLIGKLHMAKLAPKARTDHIGCEQALDSRFHTDRQPQFHIKNRFIDAGDK